jgi:hypothetical protein
MTDDATPEEPPEAEPLASDEAVREIAAQLHDYATHFAPRDWRYTRDLGGIMAIRYDTPFDRLLHRVRRSVRYLLGRSGPTGLHRDWKARLVMARHALRCDPHLPDGVLNGGSVITLWEEDGEYLQFVQPTVGALIAVWLTERPGDPWARKIAGEMARIQIDYARRIEHGEVAGPQ